MEAVGSWYDTPARIIILGLDSAGKTTLLYRLKSNVTVTTLPTIELFNVETFQPVPGLTMTVWDFSGQEKIRALYRHHYKGTDGIIWIIDSNDHARLEESRDELMNVLNLDHISNELPILLFANKQDLPHAMEPHAIASKLGLNAVRNKLFVQGSSAITGEGLCEGISIFSKEVKQFIKTKQKL